MSSESAILQRPSVQTTSTITGRVSVPTLAFVLLQHMVVTSRPALLLSLLVDTAAAPSPSYASTQTGHYSGAFNSVSSKNSRLYSVSTHAPQLSPLHEPL